MLDPYRSQMKAHISGLKTFSFGQELAFEGYVQYKEYVCFVKAMDALRGMKLLHKEGDKAFTASIKVCYSSLVLNHVVYTFSLLLQLCNFYFVRISMQCKIIFLVEF